MKNPLSRVLAPLLVGAAVLTLIGCSTTPKAKNREAFVAESRAALGWFESNVTGLQAQIAGSAGYVIFPEVGQWGFLFTGGKFGRGTVNQPNGTQIGWGAVNTGSLGLQAGIQGFKMLVIFQDAATLENFRQNTLTGAVSAVAVAADVGGSGTAPFQHGVALYQGANKGLMAGVNIGLDYMRYEPLDN